MFLVPFEMFFIIVNYVILNIKKSHILTFEAPCFFLGCSPFGRAFPKKKFPKEHYEGGLMENIGRYFFPLSLWQKGFTMQTHFFVNIINSKMEVYNFEFERKSTFKSLTANAPKYLNFSYIYSVEIFSTSFIFQVHLARPWNRSMFKSIGIFSCSRKLYPRSKETLILEGLFEFLVNPWLI